MVSFFFFFFSLFLLCKMYKFSWVGILMFLGVFCLYFSTFLYTPFLSYVWVSSMFCLDSLSVILFLLTLWISCMMFVSSQNIYILGSNFVYFMYVVLFLMCVLLLTFSVNNILFFYILFEISLIPTLVVILGWGYQPERLQAGLYLMMYTISASLPLLLSLMYLYSSSGSLFMYFTFNFDSLGGMLGLWWFISIMAFMVKMPMYLTHLWLPKAHVEAPVAGSMILAGVLLKLGGYGLVRLSSLMIWANNYVVSIFISISMWGAFMTSLICLRQTDLKSLIAYSSVGHMGLLISGVVSNQVWGWYGALVMMVAHGLVSSGLFALGNMVYENTGTRSLYLVKGLLSVLPSMSLFWFLFSIMNMAAPPSINLLGEIMLIASILNVSFYMSLLLGVSSFLAAAYSLYLYTCMHHGQFSSVMNCVYPGSCRNMTVLFLHAAPVIFFIFCSQFVVFWV